MTPEERRKRPEHHVVHDYANLVSSGTLRQPKYVALLLQIPTANSHAWHAFYTNCRKMYEFFAYDPHPRYLRAQDLLAANCHIHSSTGTANGVQRHMEGHMMHVGGDRLDNEVVWTGADDQEYLADFQNAWMAFMGNLKLQHRDIFREEIDFRKQDREFAFCGTLGREFIPL
jgi:hypothetical protein